jgi:AhpC/TSA antioxidant enzyme
MNFYSVLSQTQRLRVSNGKIVSILDNTTDTERLLVLIWSQLGDFDSLEYAWWLQREAKKIQDLGITIRAIGIGDRNSGLNFCNYTKFPEEWLFVDPHAEIHASLGLYRGLSAKIPFLSLRQNSWLNLMLMCAGIGSYGTLAEVFRGYKGDRQAPQLIADDEVINIPSLSTIKGSLFKTVGSGFQRPFELATLRLKNMTEVLGNWNNYVPNSNYLTQRGGTFLFDRQGNLLYEHKDRGILGFAANMSDPLEFLWRL